MGKRSCTGCSEEIRDEDVFRHEGKDYCPECTAEHVRNKHHVEFARAHQFRST